MHVIYVSVTCRFYHTVGLVLYCLISVCVEIMAVCMHKYDCKTLRYPYVSLLSLLCYCVSLVCFVASYKYHQKMTPVEVMLEFVLLMMKKVSLDNSVLYIRFANHSGGAV
jgi:hypothetical protein